MSKQLEKRLYEIASKHSCAVELRGDLETRNSDSEDFLDMSVWSIKQLLREAYELGKRDGQKHGK